MSQQDQAAHRTAVGRIAAAFVSIIGMVLAMVAMAPAASAGGTDSDVSVSVHLLDHSGGGLEGGTLKIFNGGWATVGQTGADGTVTVDKPESTGYVSLAMYYEGTRQQMTWADLKENGFTFQTDLVTATLEDSNGDLLDMDKAGYYAHSAWRPMVATGTPGSASAEMLPGSYSFQMFYNGTRQQLDDQQVSLTPTTIGFQTVDVSVELRNDAGDWVASGASEYYSRGWRTVGTTTDSDGAHAEMLPGTYSFDMRYNGDRQKAEHRISDSDSVVVFHVHGANPGQQGDGNSNPNPNPNLGPGSDPNPNPGLDSNPNPVPNPTPEPTSVTPAIDSPQCTLVDAIETVAVTAVSKAGINYTVTSKADGSVIVMAAPTSDDFVLTVPAGWTDNGDGTASMTVTAADAGICVGGITDVVDGPDASQGVDAVTPDERVAPDEAVTSDERVTPDEPATEMVDSDSADQVEVKGESALVPEVQDEATDLAYTGINTSQLMLIALGLLAAGGVLVLTDRVRRRQNHPQSQ